jgi:phosphatidylinositol alpha-mannosyltransferase
MEAMAAGRAVVASDIPGFRSVITNSHDGVLVPPRDAPAIAGAVEALLTNPAERARLGAAAVATARRYSWETVATDVLSFYEQTIQRARAGRAGGSSAADRGGDDGR